MRKAHSPGCPCCGATVADCWCPFLPLTLTLLDPVFGPVTLTWDATFALWYACAPAVVTAADGSPVTTRIVYRLSCAGTLDVRYRGLFAELDAGTGVALSTLDVNATDNNWPVAAACLAVPGTEDQDEDPAGVFNTDILAIQVSGTEGDLTADGEGVPNLSCSPGCIVFRSLDRSRTQQVPWEGGALVDGFTAQFGNAGYIDADDLGPGEFVGTLKRYPGLYGTDVWSDLVEFLAFDPASPPPGPGATIPVYVHRPDCPGDPGDPIAGAAVELYAFDGVTLLDSGTTDAGGAYAFDASGLDWGVYRVKATEGDCSAWRNVSFGPCATGSADIELCCGRVRLRVRAAEGEAPIEDAEVFLDFGAHALLVGGTPLTTNAAGLVDVVLSNAETRGLVRDVGCAPLLQVHAYATGYLNYCPTAPLQCGALTEETEPVPVPLTSTAGLVDSENLCANDGCTVPGPYRRGQVRQDLTIALLQLEAQNAALAWVDVRGADSTFAVTVDTNILIGATSPTGSPYVAALGLDPAIEYYGDGIGGYDPPASVNASGMDCTDDYLSTQVWMRAGTGGGLTIRHEGTGFGSSATVPGGNLECAEDVSYLEIVLPEALALCLDGPDPIDITFSGSGTLANGRGFRWTINVIE